MSRQRHDQGRRKRAYTEQAEARESLTKIAERAARNLVARGLASRGILDASRGRRPDSNDTTEATA